MHTYTYHVPAYNLITAYSFNTHLCAYLQNADFPSGGQADWGTGIGLLYIYLDDLDSPVITTPLNLGSTLQLDRGRAYVGFTAGTGDTHWQTHDILDWSFISLTHDTGNGI